MQVVRPKAVSAAFAPMEREFTEIVLIMLAAGLAAAIAARLVFLWAPRKVRREISGVAGGMGVLLGLWLALKILHL